MSTTTPARGYARATLTAVSNPQEAAHEELAEIMLRLAREDRNRQTKEDAE